MAIINVTRSLFFMSLYLSSGEPAKVAAMRSGARSSQCRGARRAYGPSSSAAAPRLASPTHGRTPAYSKDAGRPAARTIGLNALLLLCCCFCLFRLPFYAPHSVYFANLFCVLFISWSIFAATFSLFISCFGFESLALDSFMVLCHCTFVFCDCFVRIRSST